MALRHKEHAPVVRILARDGSCWRARRRATPTCRSICCRGISSMRSSPPRTGASSSTGALDPVGPGARGLRQPARRPRRAGRLDADPAAGQEPVPRAPSARSARKLEELVLALWLEVRLASATSSSSISTASTSAAAPTASRRRRGASSASRRSELTLAEAAVLAGLLKAPSKFSPASNPAVARGRARTRAGQDGGSGPAVRRRKPRRPARRRSRFADALQRAASSGVDYAVDAVLERLPPLVGSETRELVVETTIDARAAAPRPGHRCTTSSPREGRSARPARPACVLDLDGGIRALVGGRSYAESQFNRALKAKRQPGSAFKMFVYLAALESGLTPDSTVQDLPILGSGLEPAQRGRRLSRRRHAARCARPVDERGGRAAQHDGRPAPDGGGGAPARHPLGAARGRLAGARHLGGDAARADQRLRRARQRRPGARAAHHHARAHGLRPVAVSSSRRRLARPLVAPEHVAAHERHAQRRAGLGHRAAAPRCRAIRPPARPARRRTSATPGSSATRPTSSAASGSATTTAGP